MAYKKFTQCYNYQASGEKPFHIDDLISIVVGAAGPGAVTAIIAWASGAWFIGGFAFAIGFVSAINTVADLWLYKRLVCLTGTKCAVGTVDKNPDDGGLGNFDNDEFFNMVLMPHRKEDLNGQAGYTNTTLDNHPKNYTHKDELMGTELLTPVSQSAGLNYDFSKEEANMLHCEAEGEFWPKMKEWALLMAIILGAAVTIGVAGGAAIGGAIGCSFGPIGCLIGAIFGAIIGGIVGAFVGGAIDAGIMAIIFEASKGDVEDANVGDTNLGPIGSGDKVIVFGEHVYDGFHEGWNEIHPLISVMKLNKNESSQYLQWNPDFADSGDLPENTDDMPLEIRDLTVTDMRTGMNSEKFLKRATWMRKKYCKMVLETYDGTTRKEQAKTKHRWTIHPDVDGCAEKEPPPPPPM